MAGIKLLKFLGIQPKVSPELLPDIASAQVAENTKLYSGDLIPYPSPKVVTGQYATNNIQYFRPLRAYDGSIRWLVFESDVDVVESGNSDLIYIPASNGYRSERRFYYTGDGEPRQSSFTIMELWWIFALAVDPTNSELASWYLNGWYSALTNKWGAPQYLKLGMPIPDDGKQLSTEVSSFVNIGGSSERTFKFSRDNSGIVTVKCVGYAITVTPSVSPTYVQSGTTVTVTYANHGFNSGDTIDVTITSGTAVSGYYIITSVTTNTFTYTAGTSLSTSGNLTVFNYTTGSSGPVANYGTIPEFRNATVRISRTSNVVTLTYTTTIKNNSPGRSLFEKFASGDYIILTSASVSGFNTDPAGAVIVSYTRTTRSLPYSWTQYNYTIQWVSNGADITSRSITANISERFVTSGGTTGVREFPIAHKLRSGLLATISGMKYLTGTYSKVNNTTILVALTAHQLTLNQQIQLTFTTGNAQSGIYSVSSVVDANSFQINVPNTTDPLTGVVRLEFSSFNAQNVEIQVVDDYTFTYYRPGFTYPETRNVDDTGIISRGGTKQARTYVYTWVSQWDEESIPSQPSEEIYLYEGEPVFLSQRGVGSEDTGDGIPWANAFVYGTNAHLPSDFYRVRAVNIYRTLPALSGTQYYKLTTLWYPTGLFVAARTSNVASVGVLVPHKLSVGDRFKILGATGTAAGINGEGVVTEVVDPYNFKFDNTGTDFAVTATGVSFVSSLYYDVCQNPVTDAPRYYAEDSSYDFVDDFDSLELFTILDSEDNDPPPENLGGLTEIQGDMLAGFVEHEVYFTRVGKPYAWPARHVIKLEHRVVALAQSNGVLIVLTNAYPYIITGNDPANMTPSKVDALFPCVSKRSVSTITGGVIYASNDGMVVLTPGASPVIATKYAFNSETWAAELVPSTIIGGVSEETYIATHSTGGFAFDYGANPPTFITLTDSLVDIEATWYDAIADQLFLAGPTAGSNPGLFNISQWNDLTQPAAVMNWKSKVFITKEPLNLGAARVVADYTGSGNSATDWEDESSYWGSSPYNFYRLDPDTTPASTTTTSRFDPVFWKINFNSEMMGALVTSGSTGLVCSCIFRTAGDLLGIEFTSEDTVNGESYKYATNKNYAGVTLSFNYAISGSALPLDDVDGAVLTIEGRDGTGTPTIWYVRLWNYATGTNVNAAISIDFDTVLAGFSPSIPVYVGDIDRMFISVVPVGYTGSTSTFITESTATITISSIATNSTLVVNQSGAASHSLRMSHGYDNCYNETPASVIRQFQQLGCTNLIDWYVGASHYYSLSPIGGSGTITTFDPVNSNANMVLTNGNLTVKSSSSALPLGQYYGAISTTSKNSGKVYFEVTQDAYVTKCIEVGLVASTADMGMPSVSYIGANANGYGVDLDWAGNTLTLNNSTSSTVGVGLTSNGDVLGVAVDFSTGKWWVRKNGVWGGAGGSWSNVLNDPATGTGGSAFSFTPGATLYAAVAINGTVAQVTANFGATAFAYAAPAGFTGWDAAPAGLEVDPAKAKLNPPAAAWHQNFFSLLAAAGYTPIVALSLEILTPNIPSAWAQRTSAGAISATGYTPITTSLISPCSTTGITHITDTYKYLFSLMPSGMTKIFQFGEWWWWCNADVPCYYDSNTTALYLSETGFSAPAITSINSDWTAQSAYVVWCRDKLGQATHTVRDAVKLTYPTAKVTALIFPPQFHALPGTYLVNGQTALELSNLPVSYWQYPNLDICQLEDYDWVTAGDMVKMQYTVKLGLEILRYPLSKIEYISGFAVNNTMWPDIENAVNFWAAIMPTELLLWAQTQVNRDDILITVEAAPVASPVTTLSWNAASPVNFKMWVDKELIATIPVTDSKTFRLPAGYKSDTFEFGIEGDIRVRSIHVAETPTGLKEV